MKVREGENEEGRVQQKGKVGRGRRRAKGKLGRREVSDEDILSHSFSSSI